MHCCTYLITKELPTDSDIEQIFTPWYEDDSENPSSPIRLDSLNVGGRYNGLLKLKTSDTVIDYGFNFLRTEYRAGKLFRSQLLEELQKTSSPYRISNYWENYFLGTLGYRDGYIHVDGCKIADLANFDYVAGCSYYFVDIDKTVIKREEYDRTNEKLIANNTYESTVRILLEKRMAEGCYITVLDVHY